MNKTGRFDLSALGYIRHWLVAGPLLTPYSGPPGADHILRRDALDYSRVAPPGSAQLGGKDPFGGVWSFHDPGRNEFVEFSTFYQNLTVVEYYAFTEIMVPQEAVVPARFWSAGAADLWVNGEHALRLNVTRYRNPDFQKIDLPLREGVNRLCVRLQCLGIRDTRILFGLSLEKTKGIQVVMSGAGEIKKALDWLDTVRAPQTTGLESALPAPFEASVIPYGAEALLWSSGKERMEFGQQRPASVTVKVEAGGVSIERLLEIPGNRPPVPRHEEDRRTAHVNFVARAGIGKERPVHWNALAVSLLARRLAGVMHESDATTFADAITVIDQRRDCADFVLAGLLRLQWLKLATAEESAEIRRAALAFRYWPDEPGNDAMCFHSENHSLLFYGCQLLAGRLYPQELFSNSQRKGEELISIALPRIREWLDRIEARGFEEFNSGTYMPITVGAMLNVVDFSGDTELSRRMSVQIDRIYRDLALHSFGGGVISPQGRIYRDVLFPEEAGTQVLMSLATEGAEVDLVNPRPPRERSGDWVVFPASSPSYLPPSDLPVLMKEPVSKVYRHADVQIVLEKTEATLLTSLQVPAPPREGESPDNDLRPGGAGYQQHLWQATLGRDCHVFVNHPGGFFDGTKSRPGYWYGNGLLPRVRQRGNCLQAIYVISDGTKTKPEITDEVWNWASTSTVRPYDLHPIPFTHAHWPSDSFERELREGNWIFGQKGRGLIGLWCSEKVVPHDDILTGRELRANAYASAWVVLCGDLDQAGTLEAFLKDCVERKPVFDHQACVLKMKGEEDLRWWERLEPMPG